MQLMSKQKGKKVKSKFKSILMNQFSKNVSKKGRLVGPKTRRKVHTVSEIKEESEVQRRKYFTKEKPDIVQIGGWVMLLGF
jgi:folate-dependent phosphoribosylglycinamide formyltransferase PurN